MSNNLLTISYIVNTGLLVLENELCFADGVDRQYSDEFAIKSAKIGATVNIRRPPRYLGTFGPALNVEDTNETYVPVSLDNQFHVDVQFTTADLLLSMDLFKTRVLKPMQATVANRIDSDGLYFAYQNTAQAVGTMGTAPSSFLTFANARAQLANEAVPKGEQLRSILDPYSMAAAADGIKGLYNPQATVSDLVTNGLIAKRTAGLDWYEDQNVVSFTSGAGGGAPQLANGSGTAHLTTGWAQQGTINTSGWTASANPRVKVGDILQFAGLYPVNPQSRTRYGNSLKQFVVLPPGGYVANPVGAATPGLKFAPATLAAGTFDDTTGIYSSAADGTLTITIGECIITGGQFQNCVSDGTFSSTALITVNGGAAAATTGPQGIVMHRSAFALAFADLPLPRGVESAARANDSDIGMSMRMVTQYTINNDAMPTRCDVLYGYDGLYRNMAVRVLG